MAVKKGTAPSGGGNFPRAFEAYSNAMREYYKSQDIEVMEVSMVVPAEMASSTLGTAATLGTAGTGGGCVGSFGCAGTMGTWSADQAMATRMGGYPAMPMYDRRMMMNNIAAASCSGTVGTVGTIGTAGSCIGTAFCAGTAGTFGAV